MKKYTIILMMIVALVIVSCDRNNDPEKEFVPFGDLVISDGFDYKTAHDVEIDLSVITGSNEPVPGVVFSIYTDDPANGGDLLARGATNAYEVAYSPAPYFSQMDGVGQKVYARTTGVVDDTHLDFTIESHLIPMLKRPELSIDVTFTLV